MLNNLFMTYIIILTLITIISYIISNFITLLIIQYYILNL